MYFHINNQFKLNKNGEILSMIDYTKKTNSIIEKTPKGNPRYLKKSLEEIYLNSKLPTLIISRSKDYKYYKKNDILILEIYNESNFKKTHLIKRMKLIIDSEFKKVYILKI